MIVNNMHELSFTKPSAFMDSLYLWYIKKKEIQIKTGNYTIDDVYILL